MEKFSVIRTAFRRAVKNMEVSSTPPREPAGVNPIRFNKPVYVTSNVTSNSNHGHSSKQQTARAKAVRTGLLHAISKFSISPRGSVETLSALL